MKKPMGRHPLLRLLALNKIDYYTCWEDFRIVQKALQINETDVILSITSGGCNILNFLIYNPKKIVAVDYNLYQNYLLELKIEAIKNLDYPQFLQFMGITPSTERERYYDILRKKLSDDVRAFWDSNSYAIERGLLLVGEQNVKNLGRFFRFLKGSKTIENLFHCHDIKEQSEYFYRHIYGLPWRVYQNYTSQDWVVKLMLCLRAVQELRHHRKRAAGYFQYLRHVHYPLNHPKKIEEVFSRIPVRDNHFASLMLLGYYIDKDCFPSYLKEENYEKVRRRIDRIEMVSAPVSEVLRKYPTDFFTKFNLSNIFDWLETTAFQQQLIELIQVGSDGGRILYATTRDDRDIPLGIHMLSQDPLLASNLLREDRTILYSKYYLGTICKKKRYALSAS